jgi:hypothetical protein
MFSYSHHTQTLDDFAPLHSSSVTRTKCSDDLFHQLWESLSSVAGDDPLEDRHIHSEAQRKLYASRPHIPTHTGTYPHIHIPTHTHTHTHPYSHIHMNTHTHTQTPTAIHATISCHLSRYAHLGSRGVRTACEADLAFGLSAVNWLCNNPEMQVFSFQTDVCAECCWWSEQ